MNWIFDLELLTKHSKSVISEHRRTNSTEMTNLWLWLPVPTSSSEILSHEDPVDTFHFLLCILGPTHSKFFVGTIHKQDPETNIRSFCRYLRYSSQTFGINAPLLPASTIAPLRVAFTCNTYTWSAQTQQGKHGIQKNYGSGFCPASQGRCN